MAISAFKRFLKPFPITAFTAATLLLVVILTEGHISPVRAVLVSAREAVFSRTTDNIDLWSLPPDQLIAMTGFKTDTAEQKTALLNQAISILPANSPFITKNELHERDAIATIIRILPETQGQGGCKNFKDLPDLLEKMNIKKSLSCCSDYTQNFIALAQAHGHFSREVRITSHVFAEIYAKERKSWIWVDPQLGAIAEKNNKPLSLTELRHAILENESFLFYDLRSGRRYSYSQIPGWMAPYYQRENFKTIKMLAGNNLYSEYDFEKNINFLPKALRQLASYTAGIKPLTLVYDGK